ncbi:hypothetical protein J1N35_012477 [Gossypium stocksii]|uniref:Uncharacterized protein n=1 Tax=Gossypium stocksii TaxID=47602 RepID=A0A9D3W483_9ROSI|nr:hypothetical protein J1N35_012477 [Gossypium stocksii]
MYSLFILVKLRSECKAFHFFFLPSSSCYIISLLFYFICHGNKSLLQYAYKVGIALVELKFEDSNFSHNFTFSSRTYYIGFRDQNCDFSCCDFSIYLCFLVVLLSGIQPSAF